MGRLLSYTVVFCLGFTVCAMVVNRLPPYQGVPAMPASGTALASYHAGAVPPITGGRYSVADAAARVEPAVVNLETTGRASLRENLEQLWLRRWFGRPPSRREEGPIRGVASGVIISSDGYVVTNNHVVEDAERITVTLPDKRQFDGQVVGTDPEDDLAIVKIDGRSLPTAPLGDSTHLRKGEWVIAIGNPLGFESTVTVGVVSAERRGPLTVEGKTLRHVIQTDAAINQGNSGGALVDLSGELIGINTAIVSTSLAGGSIGIGFAIPVNDARPVVTQLIRYGRVLRPWIGIRYEEAAPELAFGSDAVGQPGSEDRRGSVSRGVVVKQVLRGSPASEAGLREGDVIRRLDGTPVGGKEDVYSFIARHSPGQRVRLLVQRGGHPATLFLRLGLRPRDAERIVRK